MPLTFDVSDFQETDGGHTFDVSDFAEPAAGRTLTAEELQAGPSDPLQQAQARRVMAGGEQPYDIYGAPKTSPEAELAQMKGAFQLPGAIPELLGKAITPPLQAAYNKLKTVVKYPEDQERYTPEERALEAMKAQIEGGPAVAPAPPEQGVSLVTPTSQGITPETPAIPMPPENEKGFIAGAQRFISPMTTGVGAAQLPFFELEPVRAMYGAQALAEIPENLVAIAQSKNPGELKENIAKGVLSYGVARGLTKSVEPKGGPHAVDTEAAQPVRGLRPQPGQDVGKVPAEEGGKEAFERRGEGQAVAQEPQLPLKPGEKLTLGTPAPEGERWTADDQDYIDEERKGISAGVEVGGQHLPEGEPFAPNEVATINRETGKVVINPEEFKAQLRNIPPERRSAYVKSLLAEEQNHLATSPEDADAYVKAMTGAERVLENRAYTGKWTRAGAQAAHGIPITDRTIGFEAIRRRSQQLARMSPTEVAQAVGRERWTMEGINVLQRMISRTMETLPKGHLRRAILEKIQGNLDAARFVAAGGNPSSLSRPKDQLDDYFKMDPTQFLSQWGTGKPALTKTAYRLAEKFTPDELHVLEAAHDRAVKEFKAFRSENLSDWNTGNALGMRKQFFNEAAKWRRAMTEAQQAGITDVKDFADMENKHGVQNLPAGEDLKKAVEAEEPTVEGVKALEPASGRELTATESLAQRLETPRPSSLRRPEPSITQEQADSQAKELFGPKGFAIVRKDAEGNILGYRIGYTRTSDRGRRTVTTTRGDSDTSFQDAIQSARDFEQGKTSGTIRPGQSYDSWRFEQRHKPDQPSSLRRPKAPKEHPELFLPPIKPTETGAVERGGFRAPQSGEVEKLTDEFFGGVRAAGKIPSFEEFTDTLRAQFGGNVTRDSVYYAWTDSLTKHLMQASGAELTDLMHNLGLKRDISEAVKPNMRDPFIGKIPDKLDEVAMRTEVEKFFKGRKQVTNEEFQKFLKNNRWLTEGRLAPGQNLRSAVIGGILDKLTQRAGDAPEKPVDRTEIGPEDIAQGYAVQGALPQSEAERIQAGEEPLSAMPTVESRRMITRIPSEEAGDAARVGELATANAAVDATGKKAPPRTVSKNVLALLDRDGKVTLVSAWKDPRTGPKITNPTAPSLPGEKITANLLKSWSPLVVMTLRDPVQKYHKVFDSVNDFEKWFGDVGIEGTPGIRTSSVTGPMAGVIRAQTGLEPSRSVREEEPLPPPPVEGPSPTARDISTLRSRAPTEVAGAPRGTGAPEEVFGGAPRREPEMLSPEAQQAQWDELAKSKAGPAMGEAAYRTLAHREVPKKPYTLESSQRYGVGALRERDPSSLRRAPTSTTDAVLDWFRDVPTKARVIMSELAGRSAPKTSNASVESGNALIRYASSTVAAPQIAKYMATDVLRDHYKDKDFSQRLGAVLVEDRLQAIRAGALSVGDRAAAARVETVIGKPWSPFQTELEFQTALADPEIRAAVRRHRSIIEPPAKMMHKEVGGSVRLMEDTGEFEELPSPMTGPGLNTKAFINLQAIFPDNAEQLVGQAKRGNLENPLRKRARFSRQAKGTAKEYELDYRTLAERMILGNFEEFSKKMMYDNLVSHGLAEALPPGEEAPELNGKKTTKFTIERRGAYAGGTHARTYLKNLWVRSDIAPEVRQALNVDGPVGSAGIVAAARLLNIIQLAGPTDAVWHTANMLSSITSSQGGRTFLGDLARKIPGINIADAVARVTASAIKVLRDTPEVQQQIAHLSEIGAIRDVENVSRLQFNKKMIGLVDKAGRLVRNDLYNNLVNRGLVEDTEAGRREWVNQMGQYNGRLMGQFQRFFKEAGFSPFVIAGRNFNRMAMRRITFDPGVKAASKAAALEMRGVEALGTIATLFAIPALFNYLTTGNPNGRNGVKQGQIDTGKSDKAGDAIVIDPAQWTGLRRGLRISGIQAVVEGVKAGQSRRKITHQAISDILGGVIHPWAGPSVSAVSTAITGYTPSFYKESKDPYDYGQNTLAALRQLNPLAAAALKSHDEQGGMSGAALKVGTALSAAGGVKTQPLTSTLREVQNMADQFVADNGLKKETGFDLVRNEEPSYFALRSAIAKNNLTEAKGLFDALRKTHPLKKDSKGKVISDPIAKAMSEWSERPLTGSYPNESMFIDSLSDKEFELYNKAKDEKKELLDKYIDWYVMHSGE